MYISNVSKKKISLFNFPSIDIKNLNLNTAQYYMGGTGLIWERLYNIHNNHHLLSSNTWYLFYSFTDSSHSVTEFISQFFPPFSSPLCCKSTRCFVCFWLTVSSPKHAKTKVQCKTMKKICSMIIIMICMYIHKRKIYFFTQVFIYVYPYLFHMSGVISKNWYE